MLQKIGKSLLEREIDKLPTYSEQSFAALKEGFVDFISDPEFSELLKIASKENRPLRIKYGADPSAPDLHLGHTVPLRKLRQFQDLGHLVVFIIGDFTAQIGDPTERAETRKMLSPEEVAQNALSYQEQVFKILDPKKTEVRYNSEWLARMTPHDFLNLTAQYTVARLLERDDFSKRFKSNRPIAVVEFLYPLMQGYDSVLVHADLEVGGTDQKFNLLVGRELQKAWKQRPQLVATLPIIEGTDGVQKMSKSLNNHIALQDSPRDMFGKVMSLPDNLLERYYRYVAGLPADELEETLARLKGGWHPREAKAHLARLIVGFYHSQEAALQASEEFDQVFKNKGLPEDIETVRLAYRSADILTVMKDAGLVSSKGEARRLIQQGGVKIQQQKVEDPALTVEMTAEPVLIQCGKRKFVKVVYSDH
ncbi:MAG: tyrosine--tRNA ligase [Candidatus Omnitrophica bacterium]|nr:tyrosine--tRNA ligase [Candidatus Omnitrophota bacterium]